MRRAYIWALHCSTTRSTMFGIRNLRPGLVAIVGLAAVLWATGLIIECTETFLHAHNTAYRKQGEARWFLADICSQGVFRQQGGLVLDKFCKIAWDHADVTPFLTAITATAKQGVAQVLSIWNALFSYWIVFAVVFGFYVISTGRLVIGITPAAPENRPLPWHHERK